MDIRARYGYSIADSWEVATQEILQLTAELAPTATLGFLFVSDYFALQAEQIRHKVVSETNVVTLTGTIGLGVCCTSREFMDEHAVVLLLLEIPVESFDEFHLSKTATGYDMRKLADFSVGLLHADQDLAHNVIHPEHLHNAFVTGGLTASRRGSMQFYSQGTIMGGLSGVLFGDDVPMMTSLSQGCLPLGPYHTITGCTDNILLTIDGRPALEVLCEDSGTPLNEELEKLEGRVFAGIPLPNRDVDDYVVRAIIGLDLDRKLIAIAHSCQDGDRIVFTQRDADSARADMKEMLEKLNARLPTKPKAGLYYSCVARGVNLFDDKSVEMQLITEILGEFPLVGFYGNGELSHEQIYGYTGVLNIFY